MVDMIDDLLRALPIRDVNVRAGSQSNCGGIADAFVDVEAATAYELVNATPPPREDRWEDQELVDYCVTSVSDGIEAGLMELFGELPPIRVTLRRVLPHAVDSNEFINRLAGRYAVYETLRRAGLSEFVPSSALRSVKLRPPLPS